MEQPPIVFDASFSYLPLKLMLKPWRLLGAIKQAKALRAQARQWPTMLKQIEKLQEKGFDISQVKIAGVEHYEKKDVADRTQNDIFRVLAYVDFKVAGDKDPSRQSIYFCPDSVALYNVFRVAADEATGHKAEDFLMLVRQPRLTQFSTYSYEPPGGGVRMTQGETPEQAAHRENVEEAYMPPDLVQAIKEQEVQTVSLENEDNFPALGETHHAFMRVIGMSRTDWLRVACEMTGVESGDSSEWEKTKVVLIPFKKAEEMINPAWMRENARRCRDRLQSMTVEPIRMPAAMINIKEQAVLG